MVFEIRHMTSYALCNAEHDCALTVRTVTKILKRKLTEGSSGTRGKCLVISGTSDCALYFVTLYVQNVSQKQLEKRYFGSLFLDSSIFTIWTREKLDS